MSSSSDEEIIVRNPYIAIASNGRRSGRRSHVSREQESKSRALEEMKRARDAGSVHRVDVCFFLNFHQTAIYNTVRL